MEGDGGISIEAAHASRNTTVNGVTWTELPDYGRTLSGVTPWPRTGNDYNNFTVGSGPSMYVAPSLDRQHPDDPFKTANTTSIASIQSTTAEKSQQR